MLRIFLVALFSPVGALLAESKDGPFMGVDELRRGMRGVGRTVFQGTTIDTFGAEILGVLHNGMGPQRDLILARLEGGPLADTGVIRGMSGSPVYIDGRLIGAVGYGWSFTKSPICVITPIGEMLQVMERPMALGTENSASAHRVQLKSETLSWIAASAGPIPAGTLPVLEPLATPVWLSGATPGAAAVLEEVLQPLGFQPVVSPGGRSMEEEPTILEPGATMGILLIGGDLNATVTGTLTYIDADRVVGFGHPFMGTGRTDMPLTGGYIYEVLPSQMASFKIGAATRVVGAIRQDRQAAIAGQLGPVPAMLPMEVAVRSPQLERTFHFELLQHRDLLAGLARSALLQAFEAAEKLGGEATLTLRASVELDNGQRLDTQQIYSGQSALFGAALEGVRPVQILAQSPFAGPTVAGLRFEAEVREDIRVAQIRALRTAGTQLEPGRPTTVKITLQPYLEEAVELEMSLELPPNTSPGPLVLRVGNGSARQRWESQRQPDAFVPRNAQHLLQLLGRQGRNDQLVVELYRLEEGLTVDGRELPGLPPSARAVMQETVSSGRMGPVYGRIIQQQQIHTDYVLSGEQTLELNVVQP
ncbi:MAG: hypothetical protein GKR89_11250 [Candidatus Latescibacteria bacterium]|nr:hypothetical protein [Candidatus Latescibacterota bacterium]